MTENKNIFDIINTQGGVQLNADVIQHLNNIDDDLNKELEKIDQQYDKEIETIEMMEEKNIEMLENIHREFEEQKESEYNTLITEKLKSNKFRTLDSKLIMSAFPEIEKIENYDDQLTRVVNIEEAILNDKKILRMENLEIFQKLKELYLQRNFIEKIDGLTFNTNLQILNLNNNYLKKIQNINFLKNLKILSLADNLIDEFESDQLPENIVYLYLFDNIFFDKIDILEYRSKCIQRLNALERLDSLSITEKERNMLMDDEDLENNMIVQRTLQHVRTHYKDLKNERRVVLREFMGAMDNVNIENTVVHEGFSNEIEAYKQKSKERNKTFFDLSKERMSDIKTKLSDIRSKMVDSNEIFETNKIGDIKEKMRKAFKLDENNFNENDYLKDIEEEQ
jgi:hypothetical protein